MIKKNLLGLLVTIATYGLLFLLQLWGAVFSMELFFKISVTFGVILCIQLIVIGILYAIKEDKELDKGGFLG